MDSLPLLVLAVNIFLILLVDVGQFLGRLFLARVGRNIKLLLRARFGKQGFLGLLWGPF